jgi:hypothetical protein
MSQNGQPHPAANGRRNGRLSPRQEQVALLMASGNTEGQAAFQTGCGARTIRSWLRSSPAFSRRIADLRAQMTSAALGRLTASMCRAADTLDQLAASAAAETVRLGASRAILELAVKLKETVELEARISLLEQRHGGKP